MITTMRFFLLIAFIIALFLCLPASAFAASDPLKVPNNKVGIHILFPSEIEEAAKLVNASGGEWGYVTIPIQAGDKDMEKWQKFMDDAKRLKVIPIIRISTEGDYFNTKVWRTPKDEDVIDFANFLDSLQWPTKNRYVIVFNEVNRGDEWGGEANPAEYAHILSYAVSVFKSKSHDFFIISAGLDNAAPNEGTLYMNQYDYMLRMNAAVPGIFNQIDGLSSHSYPNPAFSQPPHVDTSKSITSFKYERDAVKAMGGKDLPTFITETGWTAESIDDEKRAAYYTEAFANAWGDEKIVAITPFLLRAGGGPFSIFSFLKDDGSTTKQYTMFHDLTKVKGVPEFIPIASKAAEAEQQVLGVTAIKDFSGIEKENAKKKISLSQALQSAFEWIMKI